jgi:hypothetical protein
MEARRSSSSLLFAKSQQWQRSVAREGDSRIVGNFHMNLVILRKEGGGGNLWASGSRRQIKLEVFHADNLASTMEGMRAMKPGSTGTGRGWCMVSRCIAP